jgi:hypothetical protein
LFELDGVFIRSGKVVGETRTFEKRYNEHHDKAKKCSKESKFYRQYPSKSAFTENEAQEERAAFEDLQILCAFGFLWTDDCIRPLTQADGNGLFHWEACILNSVSKVNFAGNLGLVQKQLHFVGYLAELCYDLALDKRNNLSENPGFETPLGIFKVHQK